MILHSLLVTEEYTCFRFRWLSRLLQNISVPTVKAVFRSLGLLKHQLIVGVSGVRVPKMRYKMAIFHRGFLDKYIPAFIMSVREDQPTLSYKMQW